MARVAWERLADRANQDAEFRLAARFWSATLRLDVGGESHRLRLEDGTLREVTPCEPGSPCDVEIAGPLEIWEQLLEPVPKPFYQDLFGVQFQHGLRMSEDLPSWAAYYPALQRLVEILRQLREV